MSEREHREKIKALLEDAKSYEFLQAYALAMVKEIDTENLHKLLVRLEHNSYITVIENELKKRGEL